MPETRAGLRISQPTQEAPEQQMRRVRIPDEVLRGAPPTGHRGGRGGRGEERVGQGALAAAADGGWAAAARGGVERASENFGQSIRTEAPSTVTDRGERDPASPASDASATTSALRNAARDYLQDSGCAAFLPTVVTSATECYQTLLPRLAAMGRGVRARGARTQGGERGERHWRQPERAVDVPTCPTGARRQAQGARHPKPKPETDPGTASPRTPKATPQSPFAFPLSADLCSGPGPRAVASGPPDRMRSHRQIRARGMGDGEESCAVCSRSIGGPTAETLTAECCRRRFHDLCIARHCATRRDEVPSPRTRRVFGGVVFHAPKRAQQRTYTSQSVVISHHR